jgi:hypothetical protein
MNRNVVALVAGLGILAGGGTAFAQEASSVVEGKGYPLGEGTVLHPTLGAELGFTDNVFYEDSEQTPSGLLRLIVEGAIASRDIEAEDAATEPLEGDEEAEPAGQAMAFRAGGNLAYHEFLSGNDMVQVQRTLSADLNGQLVIAPEGTFSFIADERFMRDTRPTNFESFANTNRVANSLALGLKWQPGGRTINAGVRWENQIDVFEDEDQAFANRMINTFHGRGEWMFFPYTKAFADISYGFISALGDGEKQGANPIRGGLGLATALTEMFTVKVHVGWAHAGYGDGAGYNQPMFGAEVGYRYSPVGRFVVGYSLDARDSINADFYRDHALSGHVDHQFGKILGSAGVDLRLRGYRGGRTGERDDVIFAVGAKAQYVLRDWMAVVAQWRTEIDQTDYMSLVGDDPSYTRTEVTAGVRAAL